MNDKLVMTAMVVEDSPAVGNYLDVLITRLPGLKLTGIATSTIEAYHQLQMAMPDILVLDIRLPDGSGLDILRHVKALPESPIVIIYTLYPFPQYRTRAFEFGADYFIDKSKDFLEIEKLLIEISGSNN
jgi:DNA-binding NarL/FixJ family response regulator